MTLDELRRECRRIIDADDAGGVALTEEEVRTMTDRGIEQLTEALERESRERMRRDAGRFGWFLLGFVTAMLVMAVRP